MHPVLRRVALVASLAAGSLAAAPTVVPLAAQERGAIALDEAIRGLGTPLRVLMVGAHPDDENTALLTWLARGRRVEAAYLSLTRGDGGQNLIGNELGEALGAIRTEELLAARRIDGARQYFTRAFDFGFSKSADETFRHWPKDSILRDVITVVRAFRPHVIVSVFSGTPRDGHGHHQVAGILAREAYDLAEDTVRFPRAINAAGLAPWAPAKFYRGAGPGSASPPGATLRINVGAYDALRGRSYEEIAAESRSQHKSQGFGALERKGVRLVGLVREATRLQTDPATPERDIFAGLDSTWRGLRRPGLPAEVDSALATMDAQVAALQRVDYLRDPSAAIAPLQALLRTIPGEPMEVTATGRGRGAPAPVDVRTALARAQSRTMRALALASGLAVETEVERDLVAIGDSVKLTIRVFNRGRLPVRVWLEPRILCGAAIPAAVNGGIGETAALIQPDSQANWPGMLCARGNVLGSGSVGAWWLAGERQGDMFARASVLAPEDASNGTLPLPVRADVVTGDATAERPAAPFVVESPVVFRAADAVRGDVSRPLAIVPAVAVTLDRTVEYAPAGTDLARTFTVTLRSASTTPRDVQVRLTLPRGLVADSVTRTATLPAYGATRTLAFRVRGRLAAGTHRLGAVAESGAERFTTGYTLVEYDHIAPQRLFREAVTTLQAVDVKVPDRVRVAYVRGVGDNVPPALEALGVPVTVVDPAALATADLARFTTVVIGPRAYEAHPALVAANARLLEWVRQGGTMVVQYGQYEMQQPGIMPYPITINRPHDRVTEERAPVTVLDPQSPLLTWPNRLSEADFAGWVQERSLYMARTFDASYRAMLSMNDPGEEARQGALLLAPYGRGVYVYTSLALFRQLPAGVPGAARLFANLLAATQSAPGFTP